MQKQSGFLQNAHLIPKVPSAFGVVSEEAEREQQI